MSAQKALIYQKFENEKWRSVGPSMASLEDILENQREVVMRYASLTAQTVRRTMSFVVAPIEKYPNVLSSEELESLLDKQPSALNGILQ